MIYVRKKYDFIDCKISSSKLYFFIKTFFDKRHILEFTKLCFKIITAKLTKIISHHAICFCQFNYFSWISVYFSMCQIELEKPFCINIYQTHILGLHKTEVIYLDVTLFDKIISFIWIESWYPDSVIITIN